MRRHHGSAGSELGVVVGLEELHDVEEGGRQRVVELLLAVHVHLARVELQVLLEAHEPAADEDAHVVVAQQDHVADLVRRVFAPLPGSLHEQLVDLEAAVLDLLLSLFGFGEDGPGLRVAVAVHPLEVRLRVLVALVHDPDHVDQRGSFAQVVAEGGEVGVDGRDVGALEEVDVEHSLDVDVGLDALVALERLPELP